MECPNLATSAELVRSVALLQREAAIAAARLVRRFRLPAHARDDLRQDILIDLLERLRSFDPARGALGAFVAKVVEHRASRLARRIARDLYFVPVSIDDSRRSSGDPVRWVDTLAESDGYAALVGQPVDSFGELHRRIDLERGIACLRPRDVALLSDLGERTPTQIAEHGSARATVYRQLHEIRMRLTAVGVSPAP